MTSLGTSTFMMLMLLMMMMMMVMMRLTQMAASTEGFTLAATECQAANTGLGLKQTFVNMFHFVVSSSSIPLQLAASDAWTRCLLSCSFGLHSFRRRICSQTEVCA